MSRSYPIRRKRSKFNKQLIPICSFESKEHVYGNTCWMEEARAAHAPVSSWDLEARGQEYWVHILLVNYNENYFTTLREHLCVQLCIVALRAARQTVLTIARGIQVCDQCLSLRVFTFGNSYLIEWNKENKHNMQWILKRIKKTSIEY